MTWGPEEIAAFHRRLRQRVAEVGVDVASHEIPVHRSTLYRALNGQTVRPSRAIRRWVDRDWRQCEEEDEDDGSPE
jgi:hypothetical protein